MVKHEYSTFRTFERSLRWLRGMSVKQMNACNQLLFALRDDIEQESTYRVRECLTLLGLTPMLTSKNIKTIMALSHGNDLAFLWFIWEAFYKKPQFCHTDIEHYTINEQLILSAIAHLDMTTTMRALDQILPTAEHSKKYQDKQRAAKLKKDEKRSNRREERRPNPPFSIDLALPYNQRSRQLADERKLGKDRKSVPGTNEKVRPYLIPQLRPKVYEPMPMIAKPKDRKIAFPLYDKYKDKHYRIPNESSRFFSTYELSPVNRAVKQCLSDALAPLFGGSRKPLTKSVCNVHRMLEFSAARKQHELAYEVTQRYVKLLSGRKGELRRRHIIRQLEEDVQCAAMKLQQHARRQLTQVQELIGGTCNVGTGCQMCAKIVSSPGLADRPGRRADLTFLLGDDSPNNNDLPDDPEISSPVKVYELGAQRFMKFINAEDITLSNTLGSNAYCYSADKKYKNSFNSVPVEGVIKVLNDKGEVVKEVEPQKLEFCPPARKSSDASMDKYCSRKTMKSGLLQWDYFKIYQPSHSQSGDNFRDVQPIIRSYCIAALNQAMSRSTGGADTNEKVVTPLGLIRNIRSDSALQAADKAARTHYKEAAKRKSLSSDMEKHLIKENKNVCELVSADKLKSIGSIDPDDVSMLIKLLKIAVDILQHDPQYVLVTLPNAHMIPTLVDWVAERYGKTYNYREMRNLADSMRSVYERLNQMHIISQYIPKPSMKMFRGYKIVESYDKYHEYARKVAQSQDQYFRRLNHMALEESRIIWMAIYGYSDFGGSFTETFSAYMPAKELDFLRHRLWDSKDYRDMVSCRRRSREKTPLK